MGYITPKHTTGTLVNLALNPPILLWASHRYFLIAPAYKVIAVSQPPCQGVAIKSCRLSFPKFLEWLPSPPGRFLIFCAWLSTY